MLFDRVVAHFHYLVRRLDVGFHNSVVWLVPSEAVIDFEEDVAGDEAGAVLGNPNCGEMEFCSKVLGNLVIEDVGGFRSEILKDVTQIVQLFDCLCRRYALVIKKILAERLV